MEPYSFTRYLSAKKSVDDRAINRHTWDQLKRSLPSTTVERPLRVLEIGAGIGTMLERALEWGLFQHAHYTAIDNQVENIEHARQRLKAWGSINGFRVIESASELRFIHPDRSVQTKLEAIDLFEFIECEKARRSWDLLIAHAFLDLMDIPATLLQMFQLLEPGGLFYFTVNFDGLTLLEPGIDPSLDNLIQELYHRSMDERVTRGKPSGDSRAGRHLFSYLKAAGADIIAAGASDWVVHSGPRGYPGDEAYFLHFIIRTIEQALHAHPELEAERFAAWVAERHAQIKRGELVYIAHQLDFLGQVGL